MPPKRYPVILDQTERDYLLELNRFRHRVSTKTRGRILLKADEGS